MAATTDVSFDPGTFTSILQTIPQPLLVPAVQSQKATKRGIKTKSAKVYELEMVGYPKAVIATPSLPDADGDGFTVSPGPSAPPPPSS